MNLIYIVTAFLLMPWVTDALEILGSQWSNLNMKRAVHFSLLSFSQNLMVTLAMRFLVANILQRVTCTAMEL